MFGFLVLATGDRLNELHKEGPDVLPFSSLHPLLLNIMTLGHKNLYLDFAYFWVLQKLIKEKDEINLQDADKLLAQVKMLTHHRPEIESLFTLTCFVLASDYHRPDLCEQVAIDGFASLPESWLIPTVVGFMFTFRLKNPLKGAFYYRKAAEKPKCPEYIKKLSHRLANNELKKDDAAETLRSIIEGTDDPDYREFLSHYLNNRR